MSGAEPSGGRDPSGDPSAVIVRFLNTHAFEGDGDQLRSASMARAWGGSLGLTARPVNKSDLVALRLMREGLRSVLQSKTAGLGQVEQGVREFRAAALGCALTLTVDETGRPMVVPSSDRPRLIEVIAAAIANVSVIDDWDRLKACPADGCGAAFVDVSRAGRMAWCSTTCSNREHVRAHRRRTSTPVDAAHDPSRS